MALGTFVAGAYTSTYNSVAIGITKEGYRLRFQFLKRLIDKSDQYGDTILDAVYRGANVNLTLQAIEYKAGTTGPAWPYAALGVLGTIGRLDSALAQSVVLTATSGTPAAAAPATWTGAKCIIGENNNVEWVYDSSNREVPIGFRVYPYDAGSGAIKFWVES